MFLGVVTMVVDEVTLSPAKQFRLSSTQSLAIDCAILKLQGQSMVTSVQIEPRSAHKSCIFHRAIHFGVLSSLFVWSSIVSIIITRWSGTCRLMTSRPPLSLPMHVFQPHHMIYLDCLLYQICFPQLLCSPTISLNLQL
jgi:hypothetical protein